MHPAWFGFFPPGLPQYTEPEGPVSRGPACGAREGLGVLLPHRSGSPESDPPPSGGGVLSTPFQAHTEVLSTRSTNRTSGGSGGGGGGGEPGEGRGGADAESEEQGLRGEEGEGRRRKGRGRPVGDRRSLVAGGEAGAARLRLRFPPELGAPRWAS